VGNKIKTVSEKGNGEITSDSQVIDAKGKYVLPGLIDMHVHYEDWMPELYLSHGITTVRDVGNQTEWILAQRDGINKGKIPGPRIFCSGELLSCKENIDLPSWTGWDVWIESEIRNSDDAKKVAKTLIERGVDLLKIWMGMTPELIKAVAEEANKAGLPVAGHISISAKDAALAGVTCLEHSTGVTRGTIKDPEKLKRVPETEGFDRMTIGGPTHLMEIENFDELIEILVKNNVSIGPNFTLNGQGISKERMTKYVMEDREILSDPNLQYIPEFFHQWWLYIYYERFYGRDTKKNEEALEGYRKHEEFIRRFHKAGGKIFAESDAPNVTPGISLYRELDMMVEAGFSNNDAILFATRNAAEVLVKIDEMGTVEKNKLADIIIIQGNPLQDISSVRNVDTVIKDGKVIEIGYHANFTNPIPRLPNTEVHGFMLPSVTSIDPISCLEGDKDVHMAVDGTGFTTRSVARFDGMGVPTKFINPTKIEAIIPEYLLKRVGTFSVTVTNPPPLQIREQIYVTQGPSSWSSRTSIENSQNTKFFIVKFK
ncbi:MAG: amidohydrolase family protein, partial [Desulfatiglandales bacterium]